MSKKKVEPKNKKKDAPANNKGAPQSTLDKIYEKLFEMTETMGRVEADLAEHMRRTATLEAEIAIHRKRILLAEGGIALFSFLALLAGIYKAFIAA